MAKTYFAEFTDTRTGNIFYKFGHTRFNDAQKRLDNITAEYPQFTSRVLASIYHHDVDVCIQVEEEFKQRYPKNFYLVEKISGVTEIVKFDADTKMKIIREFRNRNDKVKKELFGENRT